MISAHVTRAAAEITFCAAFTFKSSKIELRAFQSVYATIRNLPISYVGTRDFLLVDPLLKLELSLNSKEHFRLLCWE